MIRNKKIIDTKNKVIRLERGHLLSDYGHMISTGAMFPYDLKEKHFLSEGKHYFRLIRQNHLYEDYRLYFRYMDKDYLLIFNRCLDGPSEG